MYVPGNARLNNWNESIRSLIQPYNNTGITAKKMIQLDIDGARKTCRQVNSNITAQTSQFVSYTLNAAGCSGEKSQLHVVGKAFNGVDAVYAVRYAAVPGNISNSIVKMITSSVLIQNPAK
jgi:hypothetical protein